MGNRKSELMGMVNRGCWNVLEIDHGVIIGVQNHEGYTFSVSYSIN